MKIHISLSVVQPERVSNYAELRKKDLRLVRKKLKTSRLLAILFSRYPESVSTFTDDNFESDRHLPLLISSRGKFFSTVGRRIKTGIPSNCHKNIALLKRTGKIDSIATGLALSRDLTWCPHTWGIKDGKIVETTYKYLAYYGVALDNKSKDKTEAAHFMLAELK